jgi:hypothetical protein
VLRAFREQAGAPEKLDLGSPSYKMHSTNRLEMLRALQFLALLDDAYFPTTRLLDLVRTLETPDWPSALRTVIVDAYADLFRVSAVTLAGGSLIPSFRSVYPTHGENTRRCAEFFMHAAREASSGTGLVQPRELAAARRNSIAMVNGHSETARAGTVQALVSKFPPFDAQWPDDAKCLWLRAYVELLQRVDG